MEPGKKLQPSHADSQIIAQTIKDRMAQVIPRLTKKPITISELARRAVVERAHLSNFLAGKRQMGSDGLGRVFRVLRLRIRTTRRAHLGAASPKA